MGDTSDGESTPDFCRRVVAPNKRKMEAELDVLGKEITEKDNKLRAIQVKLETLGISTELQKIRGQKELKIDNRKKIDSKLLVLNDEIRKKKDALAKLKSNLQYLKEERVDEAIRRLNRELQMRNFRLSEEKKIVNEIDTLNRSKRALREYQDLSDELNKMRVTQTKMRDELNECHKTVSSFKTRENNLRSKRDVVRCEIEQVKAEMEVLHQKKRDVISDFRRREKEFKEHKDTREQKMKKMKDENVKMDVKQKESEDAYTNIHVEPIVIIDPFTEEKQLCTTLLTYLQRYIAPTDQPESADSPGPTDQKPIEQDGMYVLPRKRMDEDEVKYHSVVRRMSSKNKRKDRSKKIQVTHTPEIFAQFAKLNLNAPSNVNEVPISIEQLKERKQYFKTAVPEPRTVPHVPVGPKGDATDSIVFTDDPVDSNKPTGDVADSSEQSRDEISSKPKLEQIDSEPKVDSGPKIASEPKTNVEPKTDIVATEIPMTVKAKNKPVATKIEEEKESQGSDDVFYDSDDDVFCDDNQNIPTAPLEKRRNFTLVSSRSDIKPLMANADFLADAIRGCGQNGFVLPSALTMCPTMSSLVENPLSDKACFNPVHAIAESSEDDSVMTNDQKQLDLGASAIVLNQDESHLVSNQDTVSVVQNPNRDISVDQLECDGGDGVSPQINGASNHTDSANLSDIDVDYSVQDLLCEINKLSNGTTSDVDIEASTDSSDIADNNESFEQHPMGTVNGELTTRPVICSKGRSSPDDMDDSLNAEDPAES